MAVRHRKLTRSWLDRATASGPLVRYIDSMEVVGHHGDYELLRRPSSAADAVAKPSDHEVGDEPDVAVPSRDEAETLILIPVYNDWAVLELLLTQLDLLLDAAGETARVLVIDDSSTLGRGDGLSRLRLLALSVSVLILRRNLGHQRAIAVGLCYVEDRLKVSTVVVMDADGEDARPTS